MLLNEPKIAVLLAAYNGMRWIAEQLASIQAQVGVAVHIYISVDPSSDGTEAWCAGYARQYPNVTLLPPTGQCGGAARNFFHLIRNADLQAYDLVALSDQDDIWHTDKLQRAALFLAESDASAYSSNVVAFWPDGRRQRLDKAQHQVEWDHYFEAAGPGCTYVLENSFALYLQRTVREQWIPLQNVTLHDWFIYALARCNGYSWHIDSVASMDYRQHPNNQVGANVGTAALLSRYRTIRSGWWFGQVKLIENLVNLSHSPEQRPSWRRLSRKDLIRLCLSASKCRRRTRDQLLFRALCLVTAAIGAKVL